MTTHDWDWTAIVNPHLVERALADQERRARRRLSLPARGPEPGHDRNEDRPVAA